MIQGTRRRSFALPAMPKSIALLVRQRGTSSRKDEIYLRFVDRTTDTLSSATYEELYHRSLGAALALSQSGVRPGDRVMLLMESCLSFYYALFGAMRLGALPVAVYPPLGVDVLPSALMHLTSVVTALEVRAIACSQQLYGVAVKARGLRKAAVVTMDAPLLADEGDLPPEPQGDGPVLLQYTSGSLGAPRAIELGTDSIFTNLLAIGDAFDMRPGDIGFSWLPLYHDMGLHSVFFGLMFEMPMIYMSPIELLKKPSSWLAAVSRYRVTHSPAPNFGYSFVARRAKESDVVGLDLSSWRVAMCGAEPIDAAALTQFADRFEKCGFQRKAFMGAYGLAENTVAVSFAAPQTGLHVERLQKEALASKGIALIEEGDGGTPIVSVGAPIFGADVRIVNETGAIVPDRTIGEIQTRGGSRMLGYRGDANATAATFDGEWLLTGDLGYLSSGEIFITGRKKDLIIRGGHNYYPQDIEAAATIFGIRPGAVIAFGRKDPRTFTEDVVIVAEAKHKTSGRKGKSRLTEAEKRAIAEEVRVAVHKAIGVHVSHVEIVDVGVVPKTTSGKLQRRECKERYERGELSLPKRPAWHLLARVGVFNLLPPKAQRFAERTIQAILSRIRS